MRAWTVWAAMAVAGIVSSSVVVTVRTDDRADSQMAINFRASLPL